ncbi:site-specific integrase [Bradyrhizobium arachidis]|nr:site-specific integrase [Bradyrhizobium arachidis]UVO34674.1 site-specific integrase [Bradyrhizobium arachidis]
MKLHEIETEHVLTALKPSWHVKPITADRTRQRLERIFDAAKALKLRTGENPAAWRGNLKHLLPSARKLNRKKREVTGRTKGHPSVPYAKAPALMVELSHDIGNSARCTEVGILTAARSQEVRLMEWSEIDFARKRWLIPAAKMKIKGEDNPKDHLVPLSDQAIDIIKSMPRVGRYVFPSDHADQHQPFFANALANSIKRAGFKATMHGMRSTFRTWAGDTTQIPWEVLEHCLAHRVGDETEAAYWRGDMIERRRKVLQAWADFILPKRKAKARKPTLSLVEPAA